MADKRGARRAGRASRSKAPPKQGADQAFREVLDLLKGKFQVDLAHYKETTIRRRIERRMALGRFEKMSAYADHLRANPAALAELHDDLYIHVTQFFRDPHAFQALNEHVFPVLAKQATDDEPIRVWVPGCSTGEEAYSIAMALTEFLEKRGSRARLQIFVTDISDAAIQRARRAVYDERAVAELGSVRLSRFFERTDGGFKIRKELRELCVISRHDVTTDPPFARLDLVSCRNLLIYFGPDLQKRIVSLFHFALKRTGFLWLGNSETPAASPELFAAVDKHAKIYAKSPAAPPSLHLASRRLAPERRNPPKGLLGPTGGTLEKTADQLVLSRYAPPGAVINHKLEVLQFRGRTAPFLELPAGQPTHGILKIARYELVAPLRALVQAAKKRNRPVRKEGIAVEEADAVRSVSLEVAPLNPAAPENERQYLVLFDEVREARPAKSKTAKASRVPARPPAKKTSDYAIEQLQRELDALRDHQQTLIAQFESSQEELTAANEELQATNEEAQSTNEELETAKEELQSTNEELTTTNDELQRRNVELVAVNEKLARGEDRFRLMVESVKDYAIYMLDPEGYVSSWNEGARRLKGYEASAILGHHYSRFFPPEDIAAKAPQIELERARVDGRFETEGWRVRRDGSRFWASVVMSRISDGTGTLIGFSKVTRDLTERKRAEDELEKRERWFRLMISGVRDYAIFMLDPEWRVATWNEGARRLKGYEESEILGQHFSAFYPAEDIANGKLEREMAAVMADGRVEDEGWRMRKDGSRFWANVVITRVTDVDGKLIGFTKVTRDLTERRNAEEALRRANESLEARVRERTGDLARALKARDEFLSIASHELKTPLTGLKLQLQLARRGVKADADGKTFDRALRQATALEALVEDLLDVSRIQAGQLELKVKKVNVTELVEDVVGRLAGQVAEAETKVELDLQPGLVAHWDERRIEQVLVNLITNALKYAPKSPIHVSTTKEAALAKVVVEDFGPGISAEKLPLLFQRFERAGASPSAGGLGLGLFIARRIVEAHHGTIRAESGVGSGSRFVVALPLTPSQEGNGTPRD